MWLISSFSKFPKQRNNIFNYFYQFSFGTIKILYIIKSNNDYILLR